MPAGEKSIIIDPSGNLLSERLNETTSGVNPLSKRFVRSISEASVTERPTVKVVGLVGFRALDVEILNPLLHQGRANDNRIFSIHYEDSVSILKSANKLCPFQSQYLDQRSILHLCHTFFQFYSRHIAIGIVILKCWMVLQHIGISWSIAHTASIEHNLCRHFCLNKIVSKIDIHCLYIRVKGSAFWLRGTLYVKVSAVLNL